MDARQSPINGPIFNLKKRRSRKEFDSINLGEHRDQIWRRDMSISERTDDAPLGKASLESSAIHRRHGYRDRTVHEILSSLSLSLSNQHFHFLLSNRVSFPSLAAKQTFTKEKRNYNGGFHPSRLSSFDLSNVLTNEAIDPVTSPQKRQHYRF